MCAPRDEKRERMPSLKPPRRPQLSAIDVCKLGAGALSSLAGVVIFYLSISDAAASGSEYKTYIGLGKTKQVTFHTSASTWPGLAMLVCGFCWLIEVATSLAGKGWDLSRTRIALAWPAINSALMLVTLYQQGESILLVNVTQTAGLIMLKLDPTSRSSRIAVNIVGTLTVYSTLMPVLVALGDHAHWHVDLVASLYIASVAVWCSARISSLMKSDWLDLACETVNTLVVPWLIWGLFSVRKSHDQPSATVE